MKNIKEALLTTFKQLKDALNNFTKTNMKKKIFTIALAVMVLGAITVTAFGSVGKTANDPLNLTQSYGLSDEDKERVNELKTIKSRLETERRDYQIRVDQMTKDIVKIDQEIVKIVSPSTLLPVAQAETVTVAPTPVAQVASYQEPAKSTCVKHTAGEDQNRIIRHAYEVSGGNKDFIFTLEAENGDWDPQAVNSSNSDGSFDKGLCQLNSNYHLDYINSEDFKDPMKQVYYCWDVYKDAESKGKLDTTFYGYKHRFERSEGKFTCN